MNEQLKPFGAMGTRTYSAPQATAKQHHLQHATFWRIGVMISELVAGVAAELFTGGLATPILVASIGLTATAINAEIDYASTGEVSWLGVGIGVATSIMVPAIPAFSMLRTASKAETIGVSNLSKMIGTAETRGAHIGANLGKKLLGTVSPEEAYRMKYFIKQLGDDGEDFLEELEKFQKRISGVTKEKIAQLLDTVAETPNGNVKVWTAITREMLQDPALNIPERQIGSIMQRLEYLNDFELAEKATEKLDFYTTRMNTLQKIQDTITGTGTASSKTLKQMIKTRNKLYNYKLGRNEKTWGFRYLREVTPAGKRKYGSVNLLGGKHQLFSWVRSLEEGIDNVTIQQALGLAKSHTPQMLAKALAEESVIAISDVLEGDARQVFNGLYRSAGILKPSEQKKLWQLFYNGALTDEERKLIEDTLSKMVAKHAMIAKTTNKYAVIQGANTYDKLSDLFLVSKGAKMRNNWITRFRWTGTKRFNEKVVQNLQLIDPNDIGRAGPERLYQLLKEQTDHFIQKRFGKFARGAKRVGKESKRIEKYFEKMGGVLIPRNRYLLGYKIIVQSKPYNLVLFKFYKEATRSERGKNKFGKPDMIVKASDLDLLRLKKDGVSYYWSHHGKKRGWWTSRGGRRKNTMNLLLSDEISLFLGFAPIQPLRNLLSIVSNWVENVADISRGEYKGNWWRKFRNSLERTSVNRAGRLLSRGVFGGIAKTILGSSSNSVLAFVGRNAPRELQRAMSISLHSVEGTDSQGFFTFKKKQASTVRNMWAQGMGISARSGLKRYTRIHHYSVGNFNSFKVKSQQIRRIPGAITPNSVFNPKKFGRG